MTGVVCTIGPASESEEMLAKLMKAGMTIVRFNMCHSTVEEGREKILRAAKVRKELGLEGKVQLALDTKGPDVRIGTFKDDKAVVIACGQIFKCYVTEKYKNHVGTVDGVYVPYPKLERIAVIGAIMAFNDGHVRMEVTDVTDGVITSKVLAGGKLSNRKTLAMPGHDLELPFISPEDEADLKLACEVGCEYILASEVSTAEEVMEMKAFLKKHGGEKIGIISKIESRRGIANIDAIIKAGEGIMVARGGLGTDIGLENLVVAQKVLIAKTRAAGKLVINATEMLETMADKPNCTRAEASDVANALWDGATHLMLSCETAVGKYPIECVEFMHKVAAVVAKHPEYNRVK